MGSQERDSRNPSIGQKLAEYVNGHSGETVSIKKLAAELGCSPEYLRAQLSLVPGSVYRLNADKFMVREGAFEPEDPATARGAGSGRFNQKPSEGQDASGGTRHSRPKGGK